MLWRHCLVCAYAVPAIETVACSSPDVGGSASAGAEYVLNGATLAAFVDASLGTCY